MAIREIYIKAKVKHYLQVQVFPIKNDQKTDLDDVAKGLVRAREKIMISPTRPIVMDPR